MAKKQPRKKKASGTTRTSSSTNRISLVALHRAFDGVQRQIDRAKISSPASANVARLQQDLNQARLMMDCVQTQMGINP